MKYFSMVGSLDKEMLERFIVFFNDNQSQDITIILNTGGGSIYYTEAMTTMINTLPNVSFMVQAAYSGGMYLLLQTPGKQKYLSKSCKGMLHFGRTNMDVADNGKPYYDEDKCIARNLPRLEAESIKVALSVMTEDEYKYFLQHSEVYFDFDRMKEIFPDARVLN